MKKRVLSLLAALLMLALPVMAEESADPAVTDVALDLLGSSIHYPQVTGLPDAQVQSAVNAAIMEGGRIEERINRMALLMTSPVKLNVSYAYVLEGNVFSCAMLADGAVETTRSTQEWLTVNADLRTGEEIPFAALFTDEAAAREQIEAILTTEVAPEQSAHLAAGNLLPLPETFSLSRQGLTLYYPISQFRTLSDRAGTVTILWAELQEVLDLSEGSPLTALGVADTITLDETDTREDLAAALAEGGFPGVPAVIGQSVKELTDRYAQLTDNELCETGRMFILEDGAFRRVYVITDQLTDSWDKSVVNILRADRLNLEGLCTGHTTMAQWRNVLGEPDATVTTGEASADSWRIVPGVSDYYTLGEYRLRLHADENGILRSVFLMK